MSFRVKLDESLSDLLTLPLDAAGYLAVTVIGQGWGGRKDPVLWPLIQHEGIYFITSDKGFGDLRVYPPGSHAGILVLRPARESLIEYRSLLETVLGRYELQSLAGAVTIASHRSIRIRRPETK